jgi:hypothetical protein
MAIRIFREHIVHHPDGTVDATNVISRQCFLSWMNSHQDRDTLVESKLLAKRFQRVLSNHLAGVDGRVPFEEAHEKAILRLLRRKVRWPCFSEGIDVGRTGFRSEGYHEKIIKSTITTRATRPARMHAHP